MFGSLVGCHTGWRDHCECAHIRAWAWRVCVGLESGHEAVVVPLFVWHVRFSGVLAFLTNARVR